jgi:hypothetical protein
MAMRSGKRLERDTSAASAKRAARNNPEEKTQQGEGKNRVALGSLPVNVSRTAAPAPAPALEPMAIDRSASTMNKVRGGRRL